MIYFYIYENINYVNLQLDSQDIFGNINNLHFEIMDSAFEIKVQKKLTYIWKYVKKYMTQRIFLWKDIACIQDIYTYILHAYLYKCLHYFPGGCWPLGRINFF